MNMKTLKSGCKKPMSYSVIQLHHEGFETGFIPSGAGGCWRDTHLCGQCVCEWLDRDEGKLGYQIISEEEMAANVSGGDLRNCK